MIWYYVQNGAQAGPVDEAQLLELARAGTVQSETLVWKEGMANWEPYRVVRGGPPPLVSPAPSGPAPQISQPTPGGRACAQCGLVFPDTEVVPLAGAYVCAACKPIALQRMREGTWIGGARKYGGFWIRLAAYLVDAMILGVAMVILALPLGAGLIASTDPAVLISSLGLYSVVAAGANAAYQVLFLTKYGATPGKMVLGLHVVRSDGSAITTGRALARMGGQMLSGLILNIGYIMIGFDAEKRALHDHIADTRVVYKS